MVGVYDLEGLFQPKLFYDSILPSPGLPFSKGFPVAGAPDRFIPMKWFELKCAELLLP